jgi:predicted dehydrogenase
VVIGLGLVGQLAMRLAQASGCEVAGIDLKPDAVALAAANGGLGLVESGADTTEAVRQWTGGHGADAVLLTAATSSSEPVRRAAALARDRAIVVVVGDVGLDMQRTPYYEKELNLRFARSYGPGRYERTYEDWGVDYPIGAVRWTEGRNLEAYLSLLRSGRLSTADLITHEFPFERVLDAYEVVEQGEDALGVHLIYQQSDEASATVVDIAPRKRSGDGVGLIGAGSYARATLVPAIGEAGWQDLAVVASEGGLSARLLAERGGFARAASSADDVFTDDSVNVVFIATRHDSHAALTLRALQAGKHVFCEKPLAITEDELNAVIDAWRSSPGQLAVGFNRRWSPAVKAVREHFTSGSGPLLMTYRVAAGRLDASHWYHDRRQGGRLLGEVCHFIDTCNAIAEADVTSVIAIGAGGLEALLQEDLSLLIRYADGSQAAIVYATGASPGTPKERLEVLGRDRTAVIDDFRRTTLDGKTTKGDGQDKGHVELLRQFKAATERTELAAALTVPALETSAVALAAAESLLTGNAVRPVPVPGSR